MSKNILFTNRHTPLRTRNDEIPLSILLQFHLLYHHGAPADITHHSASNFKTIPLCSSNRTSSSQNLNKIWIRIRLKFCLSFWLVDDTDDGGGLVGGTGTNVCALSSFRRTFIGATRTRQRRPIAHSISPEHNEPSHCFEKADSNHHHCRYHRQQVGHILCFFRWWLYRLCWCCCCCCCWNARYALLIQVRELEMGKWRSTLLTKMFAAGMDHCIYCYGSREGSIRRVGTRRTFIVGLISFMRDSDWGW